MQKPTSGEYNIYGISHTDKNITKARRRMGAVVEMPSIYQDMTAEDNLKQQYRILGLPNDDGLKELLKLVGLADTGKKRAKHLTEAMRGKVEAKYAEEKLMIILKFPMIL